MTKYIANIEIARDQAKVVDKYNNVLEQASFTEMLQIKITASSLEKLQTIIKAHVDLVEE